MQFRYRGIDAKGNRRKGVLEARDEAEAVARLKAKGIFYDQLKGYTPSLLSRIRTRRKEPIAPRLLATLSRDMAVYLGAGISIVNAIRLASGQYASERKVSAFLGSIGVLLDEGKSFSQALETQEIYDIPLFYRQSIRISEDGGILKEVLDEMSRFLQGQEAIRKQIKNSLFYPLFIIAVSVLMVAFMITVVVPKITSIFEQMDQALPPVTRFVIAASDFLGAYWIILLLGIGVLSSLFGAAVRYNPRFRYMVDALILRLPFIGKTVRMTELARFSYMTSVLLRSGVPFVQAVTLSARVLDNTVFVKIFATAADRVVEGGRFSVALQGSSDRLESTFVQAVALGEETSELGPILSSLGERYFEENKDRIGVMMSLMEPMLMLLVGGVVGFIVVAMLLPIFSMNLG